MGKIVASRCRRRAATVVDNKAFAVVKTIPVVASAGASVSGVLR